MEGGPGAWALGVRIPTHIRTKNLEAAHQATDGGFHHQAAKVGAQGGFQGCRVPTWQGSGWVPGVELLGWANQDDWGEASKIRGRERIG